MILTKASTTAATDSRHVADCKTAFVIGMGSGKATWILHERKLGYKRLVTVVLPGEVMVKVPGYTFKADSPSAVRELVELCYSKHEHLIGLYDADFYDRHPISVNEELRAQFAREFYHQLGDKPLEFGDDPLDGLQGGYHIAQNAKKILGQPTLADLPVLDVPAIAVAAGPSLQRHISALRELQFKCLIVSCDPIIDGLLEQGIRPHLVTAVERVPLVAKGLGADRYDLTFCGKPVVVPEVVNKFTRHLFAPCTDLLYQWCGGTDRTIRYYGSSTGVMAATVAAQLTKGPVYLVGHDLAMDGESSHWKKAKTTLQALDKCRPGQGNGGMVYTTPLWRQFRGQIEDVAKKHGRVINVNAPDGIGAVIEHTHGGSLPRAVDLPDFIMPAPPAGNPYKLMSFQARVAALPNDVRRLIKRVERGRLSMEDVDFRELMPSDNNLLIAYMLRSVLAQFSFERMAGKSERVAVDGFCQATSNVLTTCMPMFEEMARAAQ